MRSRRRGSIIIGYALVLSVAVIIFGTIAPVLSTYHKLENQQRAREGLETLGLVIREYRGEFGNYPANLAALKSQGYIGTAKTTNPFRPGEVSYVKGGDGTFVDIFYGNDPLDPDSAYLDKDGCSLRLTISDD